MGQLELRGVQMDIVQLQPGTGDIYSLDAALQLLSNPGSALQEHRSFSGAMSFSDLEGACCVVYPQYSLWEDLVPLPGSGRPAPEQFVVRFRGTLVVPAGPRLNLFRSDEGSMARTRSLTLAVASDDGFRLTVFGRRHGGEEDDDRPRVIGTAEYAGPRAIEVGPLLPMTVSAEGGRYPFELVYYERGGGAILHVAAADGIQSSFSTDTFRLLEAVSSDHDDHDRAIAAR